MEIQRQILEPIDAALAEYERVTAPVDARMCVESQVWAELDESVQQGWRTQEEAEELYSQWHADWIAGNL